MYNDETGWGWGKSVIDLYLKVFLYFILSFPVTAAASDYLDGHVAFVAFCLLMLGLYGQSVRFRLVKVKPKSLWNRLQVQISFKESIFSFSPSLPLDGSKYPGKSVTRLSSSTKLRAISIRSHSSSAAARLEDYTGKDWEQQEEGMDLLLWLATLGRLSISLDVCKQIISFSR